MDLIYILSLLFGYLAGSISSAIIVCRLFSLPDPRTLGSKNAGATNVHRIGGLLVGFFTLLGDFLKTSLPMLLVYKLDYGREASLWVGVMAVIGHCFPLYFSFRGGKGVASMMTVIGLVITPFAPGLSGRSWLSGLSGLAGLSGLVEGGKPGQCGRTSLVWSKEASQGRNAKKTIGFVTHK